MDEPNILATSMQSVIDEVDSCLERIVARRSSISNTSRSSGGFTSSLSAESTLGDIFERSISDQAGSDGDSDSTIVLDHNYTTAQEPISIVDETPPRPRPAAAVTESDSQSIILPEVLPYDSQAIILPEVLPLPRLLPADDVIDLSNSFVSQATNPRNANANVDVIEVSSDEDSAPTSRTGTSTRSAFAERLLQELQLMQHMGNEIAMPLCRRHHDIIQHHRTSRAPRACRPRRGGISIQTDTLGSSHSDSNDAPTTSATGTNAPPSADTSSNGTEQNGSVVCPICYESLFNRKLLSTVCGHMFCEPCLRAALKIHKKCPICKRAITNASHTHPIYLPFH